MDWFIEGKIFSPSLPLIPKPEKLWKQTEHRLWTESKPIPRQESQKEGKEGYHLSVVMRRAKDCCRNKSAWNDFVMDYENESPPEVYHHLLLHNRHIVYEIKLSLILILGTVIILICVMYIVSQCKRRRAAGVKSSKNRCNDCDRKALLRHSSEVSQMLTDNEIIGKTKIGKEFFVWNDCSAKQQSSYSTQYPFYHCQNYVFIFALCVYSLWGIEYSLWRFP